MSKRGNSFNRSNMAKKQRIDRSDDEDSEDDESYRSDDDEEGADEEEESEWEDAPDEAKVPARKASTRKAREQEVNEAEDEGDESEWEEIPAEAMVPVRRLEVRGKDRSQHQRREEEEEDEEGGDGDEDGDEDGEGDDGEGDDQEDDEEEEEEEEEDFVSVRLDYSATVMPKENEVLHTFTDLWEKLLAQEDYANSSEEDQLGLIICDHYSLGDIQDLTDRFNDPQVLAALRNRLVSLVFVSTSLWASDGDVMIRFAQSLGQYPKLADFALDQSSIYSSLAICATGDHDSEANGKLCAALITYIPSLKSLSVEGADDPQMERLCDALLYKEPGQGCALTSLRIDTADFGPYGFECLSNVIATNSVLESLLLPCHSKISNDSVIILAPALSSNKTLSLLDLHVSELGHEGVTELGIEVLCQSMENNAGCVLSRIDLSGDDGAPEISKDLQKRLNKCLIRNSKRNNDKYMKYAKMPVWQCHSQDY